MQCQVHNTAGQYPQGLLDADVRFTSQRPDEQEIAVYNFRAENLKNVKRIWRRFDLRMMSTRKMSPYLVVTMNNSGNGEKRYSVPDRQGGPNPRFYGFDETFNCEESLLKEECVLLSVEIYHRYKAERNFHQSPLDKLIGTAKIQLSSSMRVEDHVRTPKGINRGQPFLSMAPGKVTKGGCLGHL